MVRGTAFLSIVGVRAIKFLTEKQRLAFEEIAVYPIEVVFDLRTDVSAKMGVREETSRLTRTVISPPRR